jgi:hypothetical protein
MNKTRFSNAKWSTQDHTTFRLPRRKGFEPRYKGFHMRCVSHERVQIAWLKTFCPREFMCHRIVVLGTEVTRKSHVVFRRTCNVFFSCSRYTLLAMAFPWPLKQGTVCPLCHNRLFQVRERCKCSEIDVTYVCSGGKGGKKKRRANQHHFTQCPAHDCLVVITPSYREQLNVKYGKEVTKADQHRDSAMCLCLT